MLSVVTLSIKIQPARLFLLLLTTKDLEPKYAIKALQKLDVPCELNTLPLTKYFTFYLQDFTFTLLLARSNLK